MPLQHKFEYYLGWVGQTVKKLSGKPFRSGKIKNTVKGVIKHPQTGKPGLLFNEDESCVEAWRCVNVLTDAEEEELEKLYQEMKKNREEDGGVWPEYTGDGK